MKAETLDGLAKRLARAYVRAEEEWLSNALAQHLPPDVFLRAYGTIECKRDVMAFIEERGFVLKRHADGRVELWRGETVLSSHKILPPVFNR